MGEFAKLVREGSIAGPLRRSFAIEKWRKAYEYHAVHDEEDQDILVAGIAIHGKLEAIRRSLTISRSDKISATTKLRAFVAASNRDCVLTGVKTRQAMETFLAQRNDHPERSYELEEMAAAKIELPNGYQWFPNEIVEALVDGIELPIKAVLQAAPSLAGNPRMNQVEWIEVARELNLGSLYRFAEDIWDDCLWNEYKVNGSDMEKIFLPRDLDVVRASRMGIARRHSLSAGYGILAHHYLQKARAKGLIPRVRKAIGIERIGKRQVIRLSRYGDFDEQLDEIEVLRGFSMEPYYDDLTHERLDSLQGSNLSVLIDAWSVLSSIAQLLGRLLEAKEAEEQKTDTVRRILPEYAPTLQIDAIVQAFAVAAGINPEEGRRIVDFLTFRGTEGQEVWSQPLVPVGPTTVAPVLGALISPNLRRLIDVWMRQVGMDLGRRGPAFEAHIRKMVADAINRSILLKSSAVCVPDSYTFRPKGGREEQIDLLFSIGNTVFLGECKCILEPTEAKGRAMHRKTLLSAADQVLRKSNSLEHCRNEFLDDVRQFGMLLADDFRVVPLIIVSTTSHVGIPAMLVPVIDEYILQRFLVGEFEDLAYAPSDSCPMEICKTKLYASAKEAEALAPRYFAAPPQIQRFANGMRQRYVPIYAADDRDWAGYFVTLECISTGAAVIAPR